MIRARLANLFLFLILLGRTLSAATAPTITTQPANQTVTLGAKATFTVVASGTTPLAYQWSKRGSVISGATSASYTTPATVTADSGATFTVKVTNSAGSKTSNTGKLTLNLPPTITTQPVNKSVVVGSTAAFSVVASGTGTLTYQWSKNAAAISGATSASYTTLATVAGDNDATFSVKVTNTYGTATSTSATLTVTAPVAPSITTQPVSKTVTLGSTATFTVVANGTAPLTYQWLRSGTAISGATSASYTTPATVAGDNGAAYTVKVTNIAGTATSSSATLTLNLPPAISTQPINRSVVVGGTASFSVVANGTGTLTYQWSKKGTAITGATSASYTTPATVIGDNTATFTVKVTNSYGTVTSSAATLTVTAAAAPSITTQPSAQVVTLGSTATFAVVASGTAPLAYQWSKNGTPIVGAISGSYTTPATVAGDNASTYAVKVTNAYGTVTSSVATLTVVAPVPPSITTQPANQTVNQGATAMFSVVATGTAPLTYQWSKNGGVIAGATASSYTTPTTVATDTGATFTVVVANSVGTIASSAAVLTLNQPPSITTQPINQTVDLGTTAKFTVVASGTGTLAYQWSKNGASISGATASSYTTPATVKADGSASFTVKVSNAVGNLTSAPAILAVNKVAVAINPTAVQTTTGAQQAFSATVTGAANPAVIWSVTGGTVKGTISTAGIYKAPSSAANDTVVAKSVADTTISSSAPVAVTAVTVTISPRTITLASGMATLFTADVTGADTPDVIWSVSEASGGVVYANGNYESPVTPGTYHVVARSQLYPAAFATATVTVVAPITVAITPPSTSITAGGQATFTSNTPVVWSFVYGIGGNISYSSTQLTYTGPTGRVGSETLLATSTIDPSKSAQFSVWMRSAGAPIISSFSASAQQVAAGQSLTLSWAGTGATSGEITAYGNSIGGGGEYVVDPTIATSVLVTPLHNTKYIMRYTNTSGTDQRQVDVKVISPIIDIFSPDQSVFSMGSGTILRGQFHNGTGDLQPGFGTVLSGFAHSINPNYKTQYTLIITNEYGISNPISTIVTPLSTKGTFTETGSMTYPRTALGVVKLANNKLLFIGGMSNPLYPSVPAEGGELYDPDSGTFTLVSCPSWVGQSATALFDGNILFTGGRNDNSLNGKPRVWNPIISSVVRDSVNQALWYTVEHSATLMLDGRVLIAGGSRLNPMTSSMVESNIAEILDPDTFLRTPAGLLSVIKGPNSGVLLVDGRVLLSSWAGVEIYDPGENIFTAVPGLASSTRPILLSDGRVLIGNSIYNPITGQITPAAALPSSGIQTRLVDGTVLITEYDDGVAGNWNAPYATIFDPLAQGAFAVSKPVVMRKNLAIGLLPDGRALVAGGSGPLITGSGAPVLNTAEIFNPESPLLIQPNGGFALGGKNISFTLHGPAAGLPVIWSCTGGRIDADGNWVAPLQPGLYWIKAVNSNNGIINAAVLYQVPRINLNLAQNIIRVFKNSTITLHATLTGAANAGLVWSVVEGDSAGTITQDGIFTAGSVPGEYHVLITSIIDPSISSVCVIQIPSFKAPSISEFTADKASYIVGSEVTFTWNASNDVVDPTIFKISQQGDLGSGNLSGNSWSTTIKNYLSKPTEIAWFDLTAQNSQGLDTKRIFIPIGDPQAIIISPTLPIVLNGESQQFLASNWISGQTVTNVTWSLSNNNIGSISQYGLFTSTAEGMVDVICKSLDVPNAPSSKITLYVKKRALPEISGGMAVDASLPLKPGGSIKLFWYCFYATSLKLSSSEGESWDVTGVNPWDGSGSFTVTPKLPTIYTLTASNMLGVSIATKTVTVGVGIGIQPSVNAGLPINVPALGSKQFTATSFGISGVIWSVQEAGGGSISSSGLYTAPGIEGTFTVVATAANDSSISEKIRVKITYSVLIYAQTSNTPNSLITILTGSSVRFSHSPGQVVIWSIVEPEGGTISNSVNGVDSGGLYTAPQVPGTYTVLATNYSNPSLIGVFRVTVVIPNTIRPRDIRIREGETYKFLFAYLGAETDLVWSTNGGTIDWDGTYVAPMTAGTYTVTVTNPFDPSIHDQTTVTVLPPALSSTPHTYIELFPGGECKCSVTFTYGDIVWSAPLGGTITQDGTYVAPMVPGNYTVVATNTVDPTAICTFTVRVLSPDVLIAPKQIMVGKSGTYQFQSVVTAGGLVWSVMEGEGGNVSQGGLYTAPTIPGTFTVKATSKLDNRKFATASVIVGSYAGGTGGGTGGSAPPPIWGGVTVEPILSTMRSGTYQAFLATVMGADDQSVAWRVVGDPPGAYIDAQGVFTPSTTGSYVVVATSKANAGAHGSATILVTSSIDSLNGQIPEALNRLGYSVTALKNGKILIAGGWDGVNYRSDCYLYDPATRVFTETGSMLETQYTAVSADASFQMFVSAGRSGHTATLLADGRVLIANGVGNWWREGSPSSKDPVALTFAQIYNPELGRFELLPSVNLGPNQVPGWIDARAYHNGGSAILLKNGQVLLIGDSHYYGCNRHGLFDSTTGLFSILETCSIGKTFKDDPGYCKTGIPTFPSVTGLDDGRIFVAGGRIQFFGGSDTGMDIDNSATLYDLQNGFSSIGQINVPRAKATATTLADGRVLIVGGGTRYKTGGYFEPTNSTEIFDPKTGQFTIIPGMKMPRCGHDSILLPTGQVLVVGGYSDAALNPDGSGVIYWPTETELFDPDSNTWRVMDDLGYGLEDPKLALKSDGGVFIAGRPITGASSAQAMAASPNGKQAKASVMKMAVDKHGNVMAPALDQVTGGDPFATFLETQPSSIALDFAMENQGVQRFLNDENTRDGKPEVNPLLLWKKDVPSIANRPAKIDLNFKSDLPFVQVEQKKLKARMQLFTSAGDIGSPKDIDLFILSPTQVRFWGSYTLNENETQPNTKLRITLDPDRQIFPPGRELEKTQFEIDPKWKKRPSMQFRIIPIRYIDPTKITPEFPTGINLAPPIVDEAMIHGFKEMLMRAFPISTVEYNGIGIVPELEETYTVGTSWRSTAITCLPIETESMIVDGNRTWSGWGMVAGVVDKVRERYAHNDDTLYIGLLAENVPGPIVQGSTFRPTDLTQAGEVRYISSAVRNNWLTDVFRSPVPHEFAHSFGRAHANTPTILGQEEPSDPDPKYPYSNGRLGMTNSFELFDVVDKEQFTSNSGQTVEYDLMGYIRPRWVSDYTYEGVAKMHLQFVQIARPAALLLAAPVMAAGIQLEQLEKPGLEPAAIVSLEISSKDVVTIFDIVPRKSNQNISKSQVGEYLFRAFGDGGKNFETRFNLKPDPPNKTGPAIYDIAIPEANSWSGFTILHGEKVIFTKRFNVRASTISKMKPMALKVQEKVGAAEFASGQASRTIDWGGTPPDSAYVRYSLDEGLHWGGDSLFSVAHPSFTIPEQHLKINPHPIVEVHAQYGFVERVQKFVWNDPGK